MCAGWRSGAAANTAQRQQRILILKSCYFIYEQLVAVLEEVDFLKLTRIEMVPVISLRT